MTGNSKLEIRIKFEIRRTKLIYRFEFHPFEFDLSFEF